MKILLTLIALFTTGSAWAMDDDPMILKGMIKHLEHSNSSDGETSMRWNAQMWLGNTLNKLWIKSEGEHQDGITQEQKQQVLFNRALLPFWDGQVGIAAEKQENLADKTLLVLAIHGTAPYFIETLTSVFIDDKGHSSVHLKLGQEWMLSQRLGLEPEMELVAHSHRDEQHQIGSGLSQWQAGLRLHYQARRELAPYIGIEGLRNLGDTERLRNDRGHWSTAIGISAWF
ncbi:MAG: copper resistance protein B [Gammaproteobacteria bacterium]|nr:copper resistance protein B [Gammaproteobacteria bacterium]